MSALKVVLVLSYNENEFQRVRSLLPGRCHKLTSSKGLLGYSDCPVLVFPRGEERFRREGGDWQRLVSYASSRKVRLYEVDDSLLRDRSLEDWLAEREAEAKIGDHEPGGELESELADILYRLKQPPVTRPTARNPKTGLPMRS